MYRAEKMCLSKRIIITKQLLIMDQLKQLTEG